MNFKVLIFFVIIFIAFNSKSDAFTVRAGGKIMILIKIPMKQLILKKNHFHSNYLEKMPEIEDSNSKIPFKTLLCLYGCRYFDYHVGLVNPDGMCYCHKEGNFPVLK